MKILVVVDMQNDFVDGSLGTKEAEMIVDNVANKIRNFDGDVYYTMDTHDEDYLETFEGKKLPVKHCIKGTKGWELNNKIKYALNTMKNHDNNYISIEKNTFGSTDLCGNIFCNYISEYEIEETSEYEIEEYEIEEIELAGLCTDICVISNALLLRANFPNTKIVVDASCCAGVTPETHKAALEVMKMCQIDVIGA